jgi:hypothetical protein
MLKKLQPARSLAGLDQKNFDHNTFERKNFDHKTSDKSRRDQNQGDQSKTLAKLLRELADRERLLDQVKPLLPDDVRSHCCQASIDDDCLRLFADSPVWASKLRLLTGPILSALAERGLMLEQCQVRVSPPSATGPGTLYTNSDRSANPSADLGADLGALAGAASTVNAHRRETDNGATRGGSGRISEMAAAHLQQAAKGLPDERIAACFNRIARHHGPGVTTKP